MQASAMALCRSTEEPGRADIRAVWPLSAETSSERAEGAVRSDGRVTNLVLGEVVWGGLEAGRWRIVRVKRVEPSTSAMRAGPMREFAPMRAMGWRLGVFLVMVSWFESGIL